MSSVQVHGQVAAPGVPFVFVDERGQPFDASTFGKYFGGMIQRVAGIPERVLPRSVRYIFSTQAGDGAITDEQQWDVAVIMGYTKRMMKG